ncbi:endonuclease/exonuclease/phosphatase family protein [Algibacter sp. L1A34]|uniref:endonuclease/exonuclease/phosphatase family protein n=1 Tax=Algibacter sp. L1A34 TaxID=2686365 RepID=UPI00131D6740|nr:endonuclease/exonuclease/phosphatase family protein [Algibacter sp. L1A34]
MIKIIGSILLIFLLNPQVGLNGDLNGYFKITERWSQSSDTSFNIRVLSSKTLKIASWNIKDLGRSKDASEIIQIAEIIRNFDIVAIQEVVGKDPAGAQAVAKIADELNRMGSKWDYRVSDPTKSPSAYISERYAFLWKTSKVSLSGRAYLDAALEEVCDREPYIGKFLPKNSSEPFYIVNFHSRKHDARPEEEIIFFKDYLTRLSSESIFILGDFNLNEKHEVWDNLYQKGFKSALKDSKTTLKTKCKALNYLNYAIDNIYYSSGKIEMHQSGKVDFVKDCNNLETARFISDHLPIYIEFVIN